MKHIVNFANRTFVKGTLTLRQLLSRSAQEEGQGMVEYGLIIALVAIVLILGLTALNGGLTKVFSTITSAL